MSASGIFKFAGHGIQIVNCQAGSINKGLVVVASICELTLNGVPFLGDATMTIYNVIPHDGFAQVKVDVKFDRDLPYQVMLVWE